MVTSAYISEVSPASYNPAKKGVMTISGIGFGNNESALTVHLANGSGKVYEMRVLTANDTSIDCGIPGGLPGEFDVMVTLAGYGDIPPYNASSNDFVYELVLDSISPSFGSHYGGTLITIRGRNFSPVKTETQFFIGNELNWMCDIESLS